MAIGDIDLTKKPQKLELFLAKPDKTIIAKLSEVYSKSQTVKLGNVNELTFTIPYEIEIGHELVKNPNIDILRDRYLIKSVINNQEEWYIISNIEENMDDSNESKIVTAFSLPYEMTGKIIRGIKADGININTAMNGGTVVDDAGLTYQFDGLLANTKWTLGYVDATFATMYRSFDFSSGTILDSIFKVAETIQAIIVWDTIGRVINFHNPDTYGTDRGLIINYGHYLKTLRLTSKSDEMTTVFKIWGKDDVSINDVNITGQNYLEDYSYFLYPFKRDASKNVLQSSYYMSDALSNALLNYKEFLDSKQGVFNGYLTDLTTYKTNKITKNNELIAIGSQLEIAKNNIDSAASRKEDTAPLVVIRDNYQTQYNSKKAEIDAVQVQINGVNTQIQTLRSSLQYSQFFTTSLLNELKDFQIEKEYTDTNVDITSELIKAAKKQFDLVKQPQVTLTIDIVNFLNVVEAQRDWNKLLLGDIITVRYGHMGVDITAKIIEYRIDHEQGTITITIANVKDILTDEQKFIKMLYNSTAASSTLNMSKSKWDGIDTTRSQVEQIINNTWDANKQMITAGINNSVTFGPRGLMITNPDDPNNYLVAQNGILAITNDRGNTWKNAITKDGIVAERVFGKLIAGVNLTIDASDTQGTKLFTVDSTGVKILGTSLIITGGLPSSQLDPSFKNGLVNLGTTYNGVVIDSANGLVITKSDNTIRTLLNATDGFKFQKNVSGTWTDKLSYDPITGNMIVDGSINARELKINGTNVLIGSQISGQYIDKIQANQIDVSVAKITSAQIGSIYANQIVVGGGTITDSLITSASTWNAKETPGGAQSKADGAYNNAIAQLNSKDTTLRSDLRLTAALPTTITMNSSGIRASNAGGTAYAQLDYRGLYIYNGLFQLTNASGTTIMDANGIYSTTITGTTVRTAGSGTRVELSSNYADVNLYNGVNNILRLQDNVNGNASIWNPSGGSVTGSGTWYFTGNVNFSGTVTGITAKFG